MNEDFQRQAALEQCALEEVVELEVVRPAGAAGAPLGDMPAKPRSLIESLLSPQSLQWMMTCGGTLLVLGFVVWLWSIGLFENPIIVAAIIGSATVAVAGAGMWLVTQTRYRLAGQGLTLLGALALPLSLWFYDAQGLITLANGGHLWIPALLICMAYAFIARLLRDPLFVYAFVGGILLTGSLFLADVQVGIFWQLMPHVTFLAIVGWACILAESQFTEGKGDFSRDRFGLAFFRAGLAVLGGGLILLLGGQLAVILSELLLNAGLIGEYWRFAVLDQPQKIWALIVIATSAGGFLWLHLTRGSRELSQGQTQWQSQGRYFLMVEVLGVWSLLCVRDILGIQASVNRIAIAAGVLTLVTNLLSIWKQQRDTKIQPGQIAQDEAVRVPIWGTAISFGLGFLALGQFLDPFIDLFQETPLNSLLAVSGWPFVCQLIATSAALLSTALVLSRKAEPNSGQSQVVRMISSAGMVLAAMALVVAGQSLGWSTIESFALLGLSLPFAAIGLSFAAKDDSLRHWLRSAASVSASTTLAWLAIANAKEILIVVDPAVAWAWILSAAAAVYLVAANARERSLNTLLGYAAASVAIANVMTLLGTGFSNALVMAPIALGVVLPIIHLLFFGEGDHVAPENENDRRFFRTYLTTRLLVLFGSLAGILLTLNRWAGGEFDWELLATLGIQMAGITMVGLSVRRPQWRNLFRSAAVVTLLCIGVVFESVMQMHWLHSCELLSIGGGVALLVVGHLVWSREGNRPDDAASSMLTLGSLAVAIPLAIGLIVYRLADDSVLHWVLFHEVGVIAAGLVLFGCGMLCQIRSTTIAGGSLLALYVFSLTALIQWPEHLQNVSLVMMFGGGAFFVIAMLLSVYRDRIIGLPVKIREGQGMFRVLKWR